MYSILKFRYYLLGARFDIVTEHKSLTFLLTSPFNSARLTRWILALQEYYFYIIHCKGSDNVSADFFSRHFAERTCRNHSDCLIWSCVHAIPEIPKQSLVAEITFKGAILKELRNLSAHQVHNEAIKWLIEKSPKNLEFLKD